MKIARNRKEVANKSMTSNRNLLERVVEGFVQLKMIYCVSMRVESLQCRCNGEFFQKQS